MESNTWFKQCKKDLGRKIIDQAITPADESLYTKVCSVVEEAWNSLTFENLMTFAKDRLPDMELDEHTTVYRFCAIMSTIYLNDKIVERVGPAGTRYRVFVGLLGSRHGCRSESIPP
jgi:hypothetical protein